MSGESRISICVLLAVRNEAPYLRYLLPRLADDDLDVVVIDNGSTDATPELLTAYRDRPVVLTHKLPYLGYFSLGQQLSAKQALIAQLPHQWVVHQDADEMLHHDTPGLGLRAAIEEADAAGYNALNFDEFCFLPEPGASYLGEDYASAMWRYYFFEPFPNRLNRAWKRTASLDNRASMGHKLSGSEIRLFPRNHVLRHYIVLSREHAVKKYAGRRFDPGEIAQRFHHNRIHITAERLHFPQDSPLLVTRDPGSNEPFSRAAPTALHFWEWDLPAE
jgi:glycosyltransferase involved in cell wall biosynthesis